MNLTRFQSLFKEGREEGPKQGLFGLSLCCWHTERAVGGRALCAVACLLRPPPSLAPKTAAWKIFEFMRAGPKLVLSRSIIWIIRELYLLGYKRI